MAKFSPEQIDELISSTLKEYRQPRAEPMALPKVSREVRGRNQELLGWLVRPELPVRGTYIRARVQDKPLVSSKWLDKVAPGYEVDDMVFFITLHWHLVRLDRDDATYYLECSPSEYHLLARLEGFTPYLPKQDEEAIERYRMRAEYIARKQNNASIVPMSEKHTGMFEEPPF